MFTCTTSQQKNSYLFNKEYLNIYIYILFEEYFARIIMLKFTQRKIIGVK